MTSRRGFLARLLAVPAVVLGARACVPEPQPASVPVNGDPWTDPLAAIPLPPPEPYDPRPHRPWIAGPSDHPRVRVTLQPQCGIAGYSQNIRVPLLHASH